MPGPGAYGNKRPKYQGRRERIAAQIAKYYPGRVNNYIQKHGGRKPPVSVLIKWGRKPRR